MGGLMLFALSNWLCGGGEVDTPFWSMAGTSCARSAARWGGNLLSVLIDRRTTFHGDALAGAMMPDNAAALASTQRLALMAPLWGNPFGTRLPSNAPPAAMASPESMLVPKTQLFAYQDGFLAVTAVFCVALLPDWLMRRRGQRGQR
jgi:hypothetical protein